VPNEYKNECVFLQAESVAQAMLFFFFFFSHTTNSFFQKNE